MQELAVEIGARTGDVALQRVEQVAHHLAQRVDRHRPRLERHLEFRRVVPRLPPDRGHRLVEQAVGGTRPFPFVCKPRGQGRQVVLISLDGDQAQAGPKSARFADLGRIAIEAQHLQAHHGLGILIEHAQTGDLAVDPGHRQQHPHFEQIRHFAPQITVREVGGPARISTDLDRVDRLGTGGIFQAQNLALRRCHLQQAQAGGMQAPVEAVEEGQRQVHRVLDLATARVAKHPRQPRGADVVGHQKPTAA